jgi:Fe-Mn family superoxide dismutase
MDNINFLSKENLLIHKQYLKLINLKYSILEKTYPDLKDKSVKEIATMRLNREIKKEAIEKKSAITLHNVFFDSFSDVHSRCKAVSLQYGSEANFLYEIQSLIDSIDDVGFLIVYCASSKDVRFSFVREASEILIKYQPILAIDLWEHSYFLDYGIDRKKYVRAALYYLNLDKINLFLKND